MVRVTVLFCTNAGGTLHAFPKTINESRPTSTERDCQRLPRSPQKTVTANLSPQAAPALHGVVCSGCECQVHPIAGATFFFTKKSNALELKFDSDQFIQSPTQGDHVSTKNFRPAVPNPKFQAKILIGFFLKESDLAFVIFFVAEVPVSGDPFSGYAL